MAKRVPNFGTYLRELRAERKIGLRVFADMIGMKPSNLSAIENGRVSPPQDAAVLAEIATKLDVDHDVTALLNDLAVAHKVGVPAPDVASYAGQTPGVPVLLRTMADRRLSAEQIERLAAEIEDRFPRGDD